MVKRKYYRRRFYRRRRYQRRRTGRKTGGSNVYLDIGFKITEQLAVSGQGQGYRFKDPGAGNWHSTYTLHHFWDNNQKFQQFTQLYEKAKIVGVSLTVQPLVNGSNKVGVVPTSVIFTNTSEDNYPPLDDWVTFNETPGAIPINPCNSTYHYWKVNSEYLNPTVLQNPYDPAFMVMSAYPAAADYANFQIYQYTMRVYVRFKNPKV